MRIRKKVSTPLYLKVNAFRAADLFLPDSNSKVKTINAALVVELNSFKKRTRRKLNSSNPTWDDHFLIPLTFGDYSQVIVLAVWSRSPRNTYLGELRLKVLDLFSEPSTNQTSPTWYKLYLSENRHGYVTGSVLLLFELVKGKDGEKIDKIEKPQVANDMPKLQVHPPTELFDSLQLLDNPVRALLDKWLDSLLCPEDQEKVDPDDQGFYGDFPEAMSHVGYSDFSDMESVDEKKPLDQKRLHRKSSGSTPLKILQNLQGQALQNDLKWGLLEPFSEDESRSDYSSNSDMLSINSQSDGRLYSSDTTEPEKIKRKRFKHRRQPVEGKYEVRNRKVMGVLFLEIVLCSDLPPLRNFTRTSFDMDPFVVVTFGKKTFRTSWKRHTLNPIYNERLAFEVLEHERNYNIQFSVLDKDHFSFHDQVADISLAVNEVIDIAKRSEEENEKSTSASTTGPSSGLSSLLQSNNNVSTSSVSELSNASLSNPAIRFAEDGNMVKTRRKKFIRRRTTVLFVDTSLFKTLNLSLNLHKEKLARKHPSSLKIRARYLTYETLRKDFWRILLEQFDVGETPGVMDYIELISFFDALGSPNGDEIVGDIFNKLGRSNWGGDTVSFEEIVHCLEDYVTSGNQTHEEKIFEIDRCPICAQKRFAGKEDIDIVTHVAICASKDWSIVNKLLVSSYVTPELASRRWYSKVLIKLTYGKYKLGGNSANILVQDRSTGIVMEEKMSVTVRLGIRLLYKGLDKAKSKRVRTLLKKLSIKQGIKFDHPLLVKDIDSFIRFHKLDMSECLITDPKKFTTFNEFFYRKLRADARPVEAPDEERIAVSPADCRCTTFLTVDDATKLWIKGRNFSLAKLFNGNFNNLENSDLYKPGNCTVGIFRLAPQDYHRFHSPVSGVIGKMKYIEGEYYTVNPMAIRSDLDVYGENVRVIVPIETEHFGTVIFVGVGAMMVGSTIMTVKEGQTVKRGDELGYFKFGGSTVLLLFETSKFAFDSDLVDNSKLCVETLVRVGQSVGHTPDVAEYKREHIDFSKQPKDFKLNLIRAITGGDIGNAAELDSWESKNLRISSDDVEFVKEDDYDVEAELAGSDEEGLIESE